MSAVEASLAELGLTLPRPMAPPPATEYPFALVRVSGSHAHISGHAPADGQHYPVRGKLGRDLSVQEGRHARAAPGVAALPLNVPVVVEATVELRN